MDAAQISALLVGTAGVVTAIGTYLNSAKKADLDRVTLLLNAQDKRIQEQGERIDELTKELQRAKRHIRRLELERDAFRSALEAANLPIPDVQYARGEER